MKSVSSIDAIHQQITALADVASIRTNILKILRQNLKMRKNTLDGWEKTYFSNAIAALALNIHAAKQPSYMWLQLCLADLEKALAPTESRNPGFQVRDSSIQDAKYEHLIDAVKSLERELAVGAI